MFQTQSQFSLLLSFGVNMGEHTNKHIYCVTFLTDWPESRRDDFVARRRWLPKWCAGEQKWCRRLCRWVARGSPPGLCSYKRHKGGILLQEPGLLPAVMPRRPGEGRNNAEKVRKDHGSKVDGLKQEEDVNKINKSRMKIRGRRKRLNRDRKFKNKVKRTCVYLLCMTSHTAFKLAFQMVEISEI